MAWTAPMTAVDNDIFTAAQFNTYVRDNLLQTVPALATAGVSNGSYAVKSGTNSLAMRTPGMAEETSSSGTTTTTANYTSTLTSGGTNPAVTVTTGTSAFVSIECYTSINDTTSATYCGYVVSGATTLAAADDRALTMFIGASGKVMRAGIGHLLTGLTAGSNTFTMQYKVTGGTGTFYRRRITVLPL